MLMPTGEKSIVKKKQRHKKQGGNERDMTIV